MIIFGLLLLLVVTVFAVQNQVPVDVRFLTWHYETQLGLAVIGAAVVGALIIYVSALVKHRELRGQMRGVEARLREAQEKLAPTDETQRVPRP